MSTLAAPAVVTLCTIALLFACAAYVTWARGKYAVSAPATSGHPKFEIAYRIHMNTLENGVAFLPALWLCALFQSPNWAGGVGAVWVGARVWYALAYARNPKGRGRSFTLSVLAAVTLAVGAGVGILRSAL